MKQTWYKIDYSEDPKTMDQTILLTDKESLKNLTDQLVEIVNSDTDKTEFEVIYSEEQDFEEVPFQHIHYTDKPKPEPEEPDPWFIKFFKPLFIIIIYLLASGLYKLVQDIQNLLN